MEKEKNIGRLKGKVLVFGGVYSNLQALQKMYAIAEEQDIPASNILCTGDIVGYCAQPEECLQLIHDWGIHTIVGNVELQLRSGENDCGCNFDEGTRCDMFSRQWYPFAQSAISEKMLYWLKTLPEFLRLEYAGKQLMVLHGGIENTSQFIFHSTDWKTKSTILEHTQTDVVLAGHCGLPFHCSEDEKYWLNPGVIGMPANDGSPRVWYMIMNDKNVFSFEHHAFEYDHETAARLMKAQQLPTSYAQTLATGLWDNCEILPKKETIEQGKRIDFSSAGVQ